MEDNTPQKPESNGRDAKGKFVAGNLGKPKGAINKNTKDVKDFIINFLNDKAFEIPLIWDGLDDKEKATMYLHLAKLVLPKTIEQEEPQQMTPEERKERIAELTQKLLGNEITPE